MAQNTTRRTFFKIWRYRIGKIFCQQIGCFIGKKCWLFPETISTILASQKRNELHVGCFFDVDCPAGVRLYWHKSGTESNIAFRWLHRKSNIMFILGSDKNLRKKFAFVFPFVQCKWTFTHKMFCNSCELLCFRSLALWSVRIFKPLVHLTRPLRESARLLAERRRWKGLND